MRAPDGRLLVVCDACVLINFLIVGRLDLLTTSTTYRFVLTEHARAEVTDPSQAAVLSAAVGSGGFEEIPLVEPVELQVYSELSVALGRGESASIAMAASRGWSVATDEGGRTLREVKRLLGPNRLLTTPGLLLGSIRAGVLTVTDADTLKTLLEANRFKMNFKSFSELLPSLGGP